MTNQEEREKRFNEKFGKVILATTTDEFTENPYNEEDIKAFIQSEIDLALANRNKEIVEKIEDTRNKFTGASINHDIHRCGYNDALDDIINLITKDNE